MCRAVRVRAGILSQEEMDRFIPLAPIMPVFHPMPKVHKGLNPLVGRTILAGIDSLNERLSQWVDHQLQPMVIELPGSEIPNNRWPTCRIIYGSHVM